MTNEQTEMRAVGPLRAQVQEIPEHGDGEQVACTGEQTRIKTGFDDKGVRIGPEILQESIEFRRDTQVDEAAGSRASGPPSSTKYHSVGGRGGVSGGRFMASFRSCATHPLGPMRNSLC